MPPIGGFIVRWDSRQQHRRRKHSMRLIKQNGITKVAAQTYTLTCASDRPFIDLDDPDGNKLASLFVLSSVHPLNGRDETVRIGTWQADETADEIVLSLTAESTSWTRKTSRFE